MLTLYRRHLKRCSKADDRYWKRCACPMWVEGTVQTGYLRKAQPSNRELGAGTRDSLKKSNPPTTLRPFRQKGSAAHHEKAVVEYLADAKARDLAEATLYKLRPF